MHYAGACLLPSANAFKYYSRGSPPTGRDELTDQPLLATGDALLMESHKMAVLEQDVVYCITVRLTGQSENATSQPLYGKRPKH